MFLFVLQVVRNDPSYTPNIEHLVFPYKQHKSQLSNSGGSGGGSGLGGGDNVNRNKTSGSAGNSTNSKSTRSKLAEMFAISSKSKHNQRSSLVSNNSVGEDRTVTSGGGNNVSGEGSNTSSMTRKSSTKVKKINHG